MAQALDITIHALPKRDIRAGTAAKREYVPSVDGGRNPREFGGGERYTETRKVQQ